MIVRAALLLCLVIALPLAAVAQDPAPAPSTDPSVQAILETNPSTPFELIRAIDVLIDLKQAAAARPLLEKLIAANADDATATQLMRDFGPAVFLKLARAPELQPQGKAFSDQVLAAVRRYAEDPNRINEWVAALGDPSPAIRASAMEQLRLAGPSVIPSLLQSLADPNQSAAHAAASGVLNRMSNDAAGPLTGALSAPDPKIVAQAALALGRLRNLAAFNQILPLAYSGDPAVASAAQTAVVAIAGRVPSLAEAGDYLARQSRDYAEGRIDLPRGRRVPSEHGIEVLIDFWKWDADQQAIVAEPLVPEEARRRLAAQLARDSYRVTPTVDPVSPERLRWMVLTTLEVAPFDAKPADILAALPKSILPAAQSPSGRLLLDVLDDALKLKFSRAAKHAASLLGEQADARIFLASAQPCALVRALSSPSREVRFAALEAIMKRKPDSLFPGSSQVPIAVAFFLASADAPRAVVAASTMEEASRLAGLAAEMGYDIAIATEGRGMLDAATNSGDVELIVVDSSLLTPEAPDMIRLLRDDPRTAGLPIALVVVPGEEWAFDPFVSRDPKTGMIIRPHNREVLESQVRRLFESTGYAPPAADRRLAQSQAAVAWARDLAQSGDHHFNLRRLVDPLSRALFMPELSAGAGQALALIGSPEAQRALVDFASQNLLPLASRQTAGQAFAASVKRWGILLTTAELQLQYDRYNASESLDRDTQAVLSAILDALEAGRESQTAAR